MNKINVLVSAALVSVALSSVGFAKAIDDCTTGSKPGNAAPAPAKVVHFSNLSRQYENAQVTVTLTIDAAGVPHDVRPSGRVPQDLAKIVVSMVSQWRFTPRYVNGQAVATRAVLPLQLVEG